MKQDELDRQCGRYDREEECIWGFWLGNKKELFGRPMCRLWKDNIKVNLKEIGWVGRHGPGLYGSRYGQVAGYYER
jgi:hypothetical protein